MVHLSKRAEAIAERWQRDATRDVPSPSQVFYEQLPSVIDALGAWLEGREDVAREAFRVFTEAHVVECHLARRCPAEVLAEYGALRAAVLAIALEEAEREELAATVIALSSAFDCLVRDAIRRFEIEHERIRERVISMLVHDLRDPLTAVMMSANLLADMTLGDRQAQMVGRITRGARRIERMVDEVVDFARSTVDDGLAISPAKLDLGEVCHEAIGEARSLPVMRDIALETSGDLRGTWDRERVRQVLTSLITNATQSAQGAIQVRAEERPDHSAVITTVTNRGVLSPDILSRVFDPFGRALLDPNRVRGLGLGLYLVDRIARAHGGTATASSSPEVGTVFTVEWPRKTAGLPHLAGERGK